MTNVLNTDCRVIACNHRTGTSAISKGSLCYYRAAYDGWKGSPRRIVKRISLLARSRSGRWIEVVVSLVDLEHFRLKTLPPEHPRYQDFITSYDASDLAQIERWRTKELQSGAQVIGEVGRLEG